MHFTLDDIKYMTTPLTFKRGQNYFTQHKVMYTALDEVHEQIMAEVQGRTSSPYEVFLFWGDDQLTSDCSCPVGYNCKHGVAAGLHWLTYLSQAPQNTSDAPSDNELSQWLAQLSDKTTDHKAQEKLVYGQHYLVYIRG